MNRRLNLYDVIESLRPNQLSFSFEERRALTYEAYEAGLITSDDKKFLLSIKECINRCK